jgi:glycerol-3-phosphate acyltransferase PlsY
MSVLNYSLNTGLFNYIAEGGVKNPNLYYIGIGVAAILCFMIAYLLGSLNAAIIVSRLVYRDDIRKYGSGNAGMTNMLRTYGKGAAGLTLLIDVSKTLLAIFITGLVFGFKYAGGVSTGDGFLYVSGLFAVLGHVFPAYYKFKGGKGVLATSAMALLLSPLPFLILLLIFILIVAITKYVSLGSVTVAVLYPVILSGYFKFVFSNPEASMTVPGLASLSTIVLAILIVWCHRENLRRISDRTENKLSFKSKKKDND